MSESRVLPTNFPKVLAGSRQRSTTMEDIAVALAMLMVGIVEAAVAAAMLMAELVSFLALLIAHLITAGRRPKPTWEGKFKSKLRGKPHPEAASAPREPGLAKFALTYVLTFILIVGTGWFFVSGIDLIRYRQVPVVNERQEAVTFTKFAIIDHAGITKFHHTRDGALRVPRWGVQEIRVDDFRYEDQTWPIQEVQGPLKLKDSSTAERLVATAKTGTSLAKTGYRWWKSSKGKDSPGEPDPDALPQP